jgi:hypothetical protein
MLFFRVENLFLCKYPNIYMRARDLAFYPRLEKSRDRKNNQLSTSGNIISYPGAKQVSSLFQDLLQLLRFCLPF